MKSQVEPQMRHKSSQTTRDFIFTDGPLWQSDNERGERDDLARDARVLKSDYFSIMLFARQTLQGSLT